MIWLGYAVFTLAAVAILVWPIVRNSSAIAQETEADQAVYRAQLDEVERDLKDGLLTLAEAETTRTEIKRRLLNANRRATGLPANDGTTARMGAVAGIAVLVPFTALAIYLAVGAPNSTLTSLAEGKVETSETLDQTEFSVLIEQLVERLKQNPESTEGWVLLARSYRQMNRAEDAAEAYRRALAIGSNSAEIYAEFGDTLIAVNGGAVTAEATEIFRAVLLTNREEPRARFYLGLAEAQAGRVTEAIAIWRDLMASAPQEAPWLPMVRSEMSKIAMAANVMPMTIAPRHPLATESSNIPKADDEDFRPDVSALAGRFSGDELAMIQEMVGGLEARLEFEADDFDGWMQLGRSYDVLGASDKSSNAYRQAAELQKNAIPPRVQLADLLLRTVKSGEALPDEVVSLSEEILTLDDKNTDGLFISGLAAAGTGNVELARQRWVKLLGILPPGDSAREAVSRRLADLPG
jgi:cytochrome c-type biogenesis protein CcmH